MNLNMESEKPIFLQIAEGIEDGILTGLFRKKLRFRQLLNFLLLTRLIRQQP